MNSLDPVCGLRIFMSTGKGAHARIRTMILASIPSSCASTSMVALSVSYTSMSASRAGDELKTDHFKEDVARGKGVAFLELPGCNTTLRHGWTHCGHVKWRQRVPPGGDMEACCKSSSTARSTSAKDTRTTREDASYRGGHGEKRKMTVDEGCQYFCERTRVLR